MNRQFTRVRFYFILIILIFVCASIGATEDNSGLGYYRYPTISGETIVFASEGDLWKVSASGGAATRLTTHLDSETHCAISPDGQWLAFTARYEGPAEAYVMPLAGGLPRRVTYIGDRAYVAGWTPDGKLLYASRCYSTLPRYQLIEVDIETNEERLLPLAQARYGCFDNSGATLYFTRFPFQGSWAKRYKGGTAQNIWRFDESGEEAILLTGDYDGTSKEPMFYDGRIYFLSDRDGTMNVWSMADDGTDKKQHTNHDGWEVQSASLSMGRIAYHVGADLFLLDLANDQSKKLDITLSSDFDQKREKWIKKPIDWLTSAHLSKKGDKLALTARGQVFVAPVKKGRLVHASKNQKARYRHARFMPDGKSVLALSDESGELEFFQIPANGIGESKQLSDNGTVLRWEGIPSGDGKLIAYDDKNQRLFVYDIEADNHTLVATSKQSGYRDLAWSPDSRWLAYCDGAENMFQQVWIYDTKNKTNHEITSDRFNSSSPVFSPDGEWLYFISDRNYSTIYGNVWGTRQSEPFFAKTNEIFMLPLADAKRSPFEPENELSTKKDESEADEKDDDKDKEKDKKKDKTVSVEINFEGIGNRLIKVPVKAGGYSALSVNDKQLLWISRPTVGDRTRKLQTIKIDNKKPELKTLLSGLRSYELSGDGKKLMIRKKDDIYVLGVSTSKISDIDKHKVDLSGWKIRLDPVIEWRQMFTEAWRLHRDYFWDPGMHSLDWPAMLEKYLPLVARVADRFELSNLLGQMVSELETLHTSVYGGDYRSGDDDINVATLGAKLSRQSSGGFRIDHIYEYDPDYPDDLSPLARADLDIEAGDVILSINGVELSSANSPGELLRNQVGEQVLLKIEDQSMDEDRELIVEPIKSSSERGLRYNEWEYTRRLEVEQDGKGEIGYVHLRSTGTREFGRFARDFYPVHNRQGLIIDNRHNGGGNFDSWIISRLMRKSWAWWDSRVGVPESNMQYAFNGHLVVLCNEHTGSDGELLTEGLRRMCDATVIGTRSWGGEVWLTSSNRLVDRGIATAAEFGVYGPEGEWLIEGHGVDPDIVVDNLPHATFNGQDAQLEAAIEYLKEKIRTDPVKKYTPPPYPDKSGK